MQRDLECPLDYIKEGSACYRFGIHTSYDGAQSVCEKDGARMVDVDPGNTNYIKQQVKMYGGGNDFWIGSYYKGSRRFEKKGATGCPIMRGQQSSGGSFALVNCNPSNRFVCQKYGTTWRGNRKSSGASGTGNRANSFDYLGDVEDPVTKQTTTVETTAAEVQQGSNTWIAIVLPLLAIVLIVVGLRFYCKRKSARTLEKHKAMLRKESEAKLTLKSTPSTMTGVSRTMLMNKPFNLPIANGSGKALTTISRTQRSLPGEIDSFAKRQSLPRDVDLSRDRLRRSGRRTDAESKYGRYSKRSESIERNLHGVHHDSPSPPYGRRFSKSVCRRRRSRSRRRSDSDYSDTSRSSSPDSAMSDSALSTITGTSFHRSQGRHSSRRRRRHSGSYRRSRSSSRRRVEPDKYYSSRDDRRRHSQRRSSHRERSRYEQYAAAQPPRPAREMMMRDANSSGRYEIDDYRRFAAQPRYNTDRQPRSSAPHYFPQMTNVLAWSDEDLTFAGKLSSGSHGPGHPGGYQSRFPRQGPIRVNRHIHDTGERWENGRQRSTDSDHVYESLDEVSRKKRGLTGNGETNDLIQELNFADDSLSRTPSRCSGRSRASMRGRKLPALPST